MKSTTCFYMSLLLAGGVLVSGGALADNCNGRWTNTNQTSETIDLGEGHTLTMFFDRGSVTSENSPFNTVGACTGYVLNTPDGKSRLAYACARKNKDGDSISDAGGMEPGADHGTWTQTGGTGVFAGNKWSGTWQVLMADGKVTSGSFSGNCR